MHAWVVSSPISRLLVAVSCWVSVHLAGTGAFLPGHVCVSPTVVATLLCLCSSFLPGHVCISQMVVATLLCLCSSLASLLNLAVACRFMLPRSNLWASLPAYASLISRTHPMLLPPCNCKQLRLPFGTLGSFHHISSPSSEVCSALWVHGSV